MTHADESQFLWDSKAPGYFSTTELPERMSEGGQMEQEWCNTRRCSCLHELYFLSSLKCGFILYHRPIVSHNVSLMNKYSK